MSEERILSRYILLFALLLLLAIGYMAFEAQASTSNRYMLLYQGVQGLNFYCVDELPYSVGRPMLWDSEHGAIEVEDYQLIAQVLEVESCNLDNVYMADNGALFTWRFSSHNTDGHDNHRHIDRGAFWITWLRDLCR